MANEITQVANTKRMKVRLVCKHDTEANWIKAINFIPEKGEVIIYDIDDNHSYERMKIGDGVTIVSSLPFVLDSVTIDTSNFAKLDAANTFTGDNTFNNDVTLKGSKITIEESGDAVNHVGYLDWNSIKLLDVNNGEGLTYTFPYESVSNDAGTIRTIASLEAANTFTGTNTFKKHIVIEPAAAPEECIEFKNANITWYGNWISGGSSDSHYNFLLPRSKTGNHTFAMLDDIVEFKESNPLGAGTYKCSLTREITQWLNGSYGSYCCPGYLVAGYGSGNPSGSTSIVAIGPDGLYKLTSSAAKVKYVLPDLDVESTTIATLNSENTFVGKNDFIYTPSGLSLQTTIRLDPANAQLLIGGGGVGEIATYVGMTPSGLTLKNTAGTYTHTLPSKSGTLALTSDLPSTSDFASLTKDNTFNGKNIFRKSIKAESSSANAEYRADGITVQTISSDSMEQFSLGFPSESGTLAIAENIPQNIQDSTGISSLQQKQDGTTGTFDFTGKNTNATALDSSLTGSIPYGGVGDFAAAFGGKSGALGKRSFAAGTTTIAKGNYSAAFGDNSVSLAADSMATGYSTTTKGLASFTAGVETVTRDTEWTKPSSGGSGSGGSGSGSDIPTTNVRGQGAVAVGVKTLSTGYGSIATGISTVSNGTGSFSSGVGTVAKETGSVALGANTEANGLNSIAAGDSSVAQGGNSLAVGVGVKTYREGELAIGKYNVSDDTGNTLFSIGAGTDNNNRNNVFSVTASNFKVSLDSYFNNLDGSYIIGSKVRSRGAPIDSFDVVRLQDLSGYATSGDLDNYALKTNVPTLSGNNTFTGVTTFKSQPVIVQSNFLASNGTNLTDTASLNYKSISRNANNKSYTLTIPEKNGTIAVTSDIRPTANPTEDSIVVWHSDGTCEWKAISSLTTSTTSTNAANSVY